AVDRPSRLELLKRSQARQIRQLSRAPGAACCRQGIVRRPAGRVEAQGRAILGGAQGRQLFTLRGVEDFVSRTSALTPCQHPGATSAWDGPTREGGGSPPT